MQTALLSLLLVQRIQPFTDSGCWAKLLCHIKGHARALETQSHRSRYSMLIQLLVSTQNDVCK